MSGIKSLQNNSKDLENLRKNFLFTTFSSSTPKKTNSTLATLHRKNYPQNIQMDLKTNTIRKRYKIAKGLPEFIEEFLKEKTPKKFRAQSRIDTHHLISIPKSPLIQKFKTGKKKPKPEVTTLSFDSFKSRFTKSSRISTTQTTRSKVFLNSSDLSNIKLKAKDNLIEKTRYIRIRKKEPKVPQHELNFNEKISRLRQIIKDPLVYGID